MTKEIIARYEIQSEIGRGGMATVYLAYDPNFRRNVAIKLVSGNLQAEHMYRERFEREAHLIARIEHPAIVPVYDYGEHEQSLYLVMRYMPGGSLAGKIKSGRLSLGDASQIISQIAPALDAVHAQGIVHRDLKPANILFDGFGNPAISDFGIAHFTAATSDLTGSAVIGTPAYMSPEQVRSDRTLDGRSDIYALGVILFEMLAGHGPFQATTPLNIAFKHLTDPIPSIRLIRPDLPPEVEDILDKALAKEREMRYATASDLMLDLRSIPETALSSQSSPRMPTPADADAATEADTTGDLAGFSKTSALDWDVPAPAEVDRSPKPASTTAKPVSAASSRLLPILALAGAALFLLFVCGSLGIFGTWAGLRGWFSASTPTLPAAPSATLSTDAQQLVLFSDDFSDPDSGWPTGQNDLGVYSYQPDGYHILVREVNQVLWASTNRVHEDVSIFVDAAPLTNANGYYGLLCRENEQNFYYFVVQGNGSYTMGKYKDGQFGSFFAEGWRQSDGIRTGNQANRLQADCIGNNLRFFANNILLGEATDTDLTSGFSGLLAASLEEQDFGARFNHYLVTKRDP